MTNNLITIQQQFDKVMQSQYISARTDYEAISTWLREYVNSPNTLIAYRQVAEKFYMWLNYNGIELSQVTREIIQAYQLFLANPTPQEIWCGPTKPKNHPDWKPFVEGLSNSSVSYNLMVLKAMYTYLVDSEYLTKNPFKLIKSLKQGFVSNKVIEHYLTEEEYQLLTMEINKMPENSTIEKAEKIRARWVFALLYYTGCRRSEISNAKMRDFIKKRDKWWFKVIGKGNKYGEIPVVQSLLDELIIYRRANGLSDYPTTYEEHGLILSFRKRQSIDHSMLYKFIKKVSQYVADNLQLIHPDKANKIKQVTTHWLRHTSATHQVNSGIDLRVVQKNLRHSLIETTMRYQHTEDDQRHDETNEKFSIET